MTPLISTWNYDQELQKSLYTIVQGKERIEMILDFIESHKKDSSPTGLLDSLDEDQRQTFWHYQISMHNIVTELSEDEMIEFIALYEETQ